VTDDVSGDDNSKGEFDDIDFNIAFSSPSDFEELSEDWEIISQTATKIELRHVSGGGGGTDLLTFGKL
jgi:predicted nucleotidyltransferase